MTAPFTGRCRGNQIESNDGLTWTYADDGSPWNDRRSCPECGVTPTQPEAPDPCLGCLPGVRFACCGHGGRMTEYVLTEDGTTYQTVQAWREAKEVPAP